MNEHLYIIDSPPGICNQQDFDHDFKLLIDDIYRKNPESALRAFTLVKLAVDKGYALNW